LQFSSLRTSTSAGGAFLPSLLFPCPLSSIRHPSAWILGCVAPRQRDTLSGSDRTLDVFKTRDLQRPTNPQRTTHDRLFSCARATLLATVASRRARDSSRSRTTPPPPSRRLSVIAYGTATANRQIAGIATPLFSAQGGV
jgi:hypothetical protein